MCRHRESSSPRWATYNYVPLHSPDHIILYHYSLVSTPPALLELDWNATQVMDQAAISCTSCIRLTVTITANDDEAAAALLLVAQARLGGPAVAPFLGGGSAAAVALQSSGVVPLDPTNISLLRCERRSRHLFELLLQT